MKQPIRGIHHVSVIAGAAQPNLDFYAGFLGLRLVKKTVNFDDPGTYHLYYGDEAGRPGTLLTFFPWVDAVRGRAGRGMASATSFILPPSALDFWMERLADAAYPFEGPVERFGESVITFKDPDGLQIELVGDGTVSDEDGWGGGPVPAEHALRGLHGVTLMLDDVDPTVRLLRDVFGYVEVGEDSGGIRVRPAESGAPGRVVDLMPTIERGRAGAGTIHHVAFRVQDDEEQLALRDDLAAFGLDVTDVRNRVYFRSIYVREPGGVLFEIATDPPGFEVDESADALGSSLMLPPWLEERRPRIELRLPELHAPRFTETDRR